MFFPTKTKPNPKTDQKIFAHSFLPPKKPDLRIPPFPIWNNINIYKPFKKKAKKNSSKYTARSRQILSPLGGKERFHPLGARAQAGPLERGRFGGRLGPGNLGRLRPGTLKSCKKCGICVVLDMNWSIHGACNDIVKGLKSIRWCIFF